MSFFGLFVFESVESCFIWAPVRCLLRSSFMERNARPCSMCLVTPPLLVLPFFYFFFKKKKTGSDSGSVADSFIHNHLLSLPYSRSNAKIFHSSFGSVHRFALGTNFDFIHFQLLRFFFVFFLPFFFFFFFFFFTLQILQNLRKNRTERRGRLGSDALSKQRQSNTKNSLIMKVKKKTYKGPQKKTREKYTNDTKR